MSGKSKPHLSLTAILAALILVAGCITVPKEDTGAAGGPTPAAEAGQSDPPRPQTPKAEDPTPIEERWYCGDITLTATCEPEDDPSAGNQCRGTVKIGKFPIKRTWFQIAGVNRRWDWCRRTTDGAYECTFIIYPKGIGRYFDFRGVPLGGTAEARGMSCTEIRW